MTPHAKVMAARARALAARGRVMASFGDVKARLTPRSLTQEAVETATQGAAKLARSSAEAVRTRPVLVAALASGITLFFARGAIARAVKRRPAPKDATGTRPASLNVKRPRRAKRGKHDG